MGMAASQARYLSLQARQSNLEYQGQQINQERSILSQQVTSLYNSLLAMTVPTPPSTSDFTKIVYSGSLNASSFSIGNISPKGANYTVDLEYTKTGHSVTSAGKGQVKATPQKITVSPVATEPTTQTIATGTKMDPNKEYNEGTPILHQVFSSNEIQGTDSGVYVLENGKFVKTDKDTVDFEKQQVFVKRDLQNPKDIDGDDIVDSDSDNFDKTTDYQYTGETNVTTNPGVYSESSIFNYIVEEGGTYRNATKDDFTYNSTTKMWEFNPNKNFFKQSSEGMEIANPNYNGSENSIGGNPLYELDSSSATARITEEEMEGYLQALQHKFPEMSEEEIKEGFYVYFTDDGKTPHFVRSQDIDARTNVDEQGNYWAEYYDYVADGKYTESQTMEDCKLTFDSSGRITAISIPTIANDGSTIYTDVKLEATTETDELAYQEAYAQYEYAQYEYDKKQQENNAKTEIIQQQDRNLELKLQRLDNERTQITTEMDALKKVIGDNIDKSYKTFSG